MITVYYHPLACSLGVQVALLEAGVTHERVEVDLRGDRTEYRKINPLGTVPALDTGAGVLTESTAIMAWLAQTYPQAKLLPTDALGFAKGLSFLSWLSSSVHIARRQAMYPVRFSADPASHAGILEIGKAQYQACLQRINSMLAGRDFVMGGQQPDACDFQLMSYAHWCAIDGRALTDLPEFQRWTAAMMKRPAVQEALRRVNSPLLK